MEDLFIKLTRAVEGAPLIACSASFVWGVLSIILSPCHLASIPLIVGFIDGQGRLSLRRAFLLSVLFASGILITVGFIGFITAFMGRIIGDVGRWGNYFVAIVFFVVGLNLLEIVPLPWNGPRGVNFRYKGFLASFVLGLFFGIALGPCTFAYMAPMLAITFKLSSSNLAYGILLLIFYGIGHCSVIVFSGTFAEVVQHYMNWTERSKGTIFVKKICGLLVICGGIYLIYTAC